MWNRRRGQRPQHRPDPDRGPAPPRIPRLRLVRRRRPPGRRAAARAQHRPGGRAERERRGRRHRQRHRHRPHALGDARRAGRAQRASAFLARAGAGRRRCADRRQASGIGRSGRIALVHNGIIENHDELRAGAAREGLRVREPDRHRGHRPPDRQPLRGRPARGGAACRAAPARRLCDRGVLPRRAAAGRRRAPRLAAGAGRRHARRRARELPGVRRDGAGRRHRPDRLPRGRRRRRPAARQALGHATRPAQGNWRAVERETRTVQAHSRRGRARPVPPLHAEGDLRAAEGDRRHARRGARASRPSCSATARTASSSRSTRC